MSAFLSRYATPLTTGLFLVSLVSGLALFFHFESRLFHGMHEWLSLALILPFVLHVWKNWRSFITYFKRPPMAIALGVSLAAAVAMAAPALMSDTTGGERRGPPQMAAAMRLLENGTVGSVAALDGRDAETLGKALTDAGMSLPSPQATLKEIAAASGKTVFDVVGVVAQSR